MPLASGADVAIGAYEFMLATDVEEPYVHLYENLYGDESEIAGSKDKKTANKNILFWGYDDFRRGDGLRYWDKDQPDRYWAGNANPRIPGAITSPPTRSIASTITTGVTPTGGFFAFAGVRLWYATGDQLYYSQDGATWTENSDMATELPASYQITAMASDGISVYVAASDGTNRGIWEADTASSVSDTVNAHVGAAYLGLAVKDQYLYAWTSSELMRYKHTDTPPYTHADATHRVYAPRRAASVTAYADMVTTDNAVVMLRSDVSRSTLHEYRLDQSTNKLAGREFWNMPLGFTGRKLCTSGGVLYVLGDYSDKVALWAYSLTTHQPFFLGYVGEANSAVNVRYLAPSYGAQVMIGVDNGTTSYNYIYDAEEDSFSQLDERTIAADGTLTAGATFKNRRVSAAFATTSTKINRWVQDTDTPAASWTWDSAAYDIGFPQDEKVLLGFHVTLDPTITNSTVRIWYQIDESGSWVDTGTDATAAAKHTYIQVSTGSSTIKYRTLRIRMVGALGARCFSVISRSYINSKQEVWKLVLDLHNEAGTTKRKSNSASAAEKLRDNLHTLVSNGSVVTFKDGRRKRRKSSTANTGYTSHTVLVEFPKDSVDSGREGTAEVILRSVAASA
jgi:hypothetical protein